jgi:nicotinate-nucleotide adenylyltransferase
MTRKKVAVYTGTFDPIHDGHIAFMQSALQQLELECIVLIPEKTPRGKQNVSPINHRIAMAKLATKGMPVVVQKLNADTARFSDIKSLVGAAVYDLHLMIGSDVALTLKTWPELGTIAKNMKFIIGIRSNDEAARMHTLMAHLEVNPDRYTCIQTTAAHSSSSQVRSGQARFLASIEQYIQKHHLYTL